MLVKTRGIVLHSVPYNDKYSIVHIYTEAFGRMSYLVARNRGKKSRVPKALFIPLSVVDMEVEHLNTREIQRIREINVGFPVNDIATHPVKRCIALFLSETLYRTVRSKEADSLIFNYLYDSIRWLEIADKGIANFHLVFLIHLVRYLGVFPDTDSYRPDSFFDLMNGSFTVAPPEHKHYLDRDESTVFSRLLRMNYENMELYTFNHHERRNIIGRILEYYRLHLPDFPEIKSLAVMHSVFEG